MSEVIFTKPELSSVIIERVLINEGSIHLVRVNFKRFMCLVIESSVQKVPEEIKLVQIFPTNQP